MMKSNTRANGARMRISQVVADARATLEEPTRPVTPQVFDERMNYTMKNLSTIPSSNNKGLKVGKKTAVNSDVEIPVTPTPIAARPPNNQNPVNYESKNLLSDVYEMLRDAESDFRASKDVDEDEFQYFVTKLKESLERMIKKMKTNKSDFRKCLSYYCCLFVFTIFCFYCRSSR
jgi:ElaB/YqjD/DUF883 family membrane-anchored ribosome-binding protein